MMSVLHAASLAPITILADALALGSASPPPHSNRRGFEYGWVRGTGSATFIAGTLLSGQAVSAFGLDLIVGLQAALLGAAAFAAVLVPELIHHRPAAAVRAPAGGVLILLRLPLFRNLVLVAALILGSHAMHDAFAVIRWSAAGISQVTASLLWSESVAADVLVFFVIGPALVTRLTAGGRARCCRAGGYAALDGGGADHGRGRAGAGATASRHHLCAAPSRLHAPARPHRAARSRRYGQAIYGTVGIGAAVALLTVVSGALYSHLGAQGFWVMAALCALALPLTWKPREDIFD
jgi:PPP family 3-phenylpropionic acid transporter